MAYCCIDLNARDFTKFGMLFAGNGKWRDQQIVSKEFIDETFQTVSKFSSPRVGGYSMHWWVASNDEKNKIFYASGKYGQYIFVDRENDLVVTKITKYQPTGGSIQDFGDFQWLKEIDNFYILLTVSAFLESTGLMKFGEGHITTPITREAGQQTSFRKNFQSFVDILKELN
jgi:CubicO group peptidase (beta-lactamase class C family)